MQALTRTIKQRYQMLVAAFLILGAAVPGCGLLTLPLALVGAVFSLVQIPLSMALSLVGPATSAAAAAAPYALMFAKVDDRQSDWNLVIFQNDTGKPSKIFFEQVAAFGKNHGAAKSYPPSPAELKKFVRARAMRCYLVRV